jgi:hypothetical protein
MKMQPKQFRDRLRKYNKIIAFAGATIVLTTFIVKEGWREHLKNLGETIAGAQNAFSLHADSQAIISYLNSLGSEIEAIRGKISNSEFGFTALGVNRTMLLYSWQLQQLDTSVENLTALLEGLPNVQRRKSEVCEIAKELQGLHKQHRSIGEITARAASTLTPEGYYQPAEANAVSSQILLLSASLLDIYRRVDRATSGTLADATAGRSRQEKMYGIATRVSYGLYALGWLFGLVGRLYGIDGMSAGA